MPKKQNIPVILLKAPKTSNRVYESFTDNSSDDNWNDIGQDLNERNSSHSENQN